MPRAAATTGAAGAWEQAVGLVMVALAVVVVDAAAVMAWGTEAAWTGSTTAIAARQPGCGGGGGFGGGEGDEAGI